FYQNGNEGNLASWPEEKQFLGQFLELQQINNIYEDQFKMSSTKSFFLKKAETQKSTLYHF
ncbi:MAG: hypothetical protein KDD50_15245, partial [Bdellovibrionales bacterium]|nr:hypothetical protein [Bdellovibrionales bacterium]